MYETEITYTDWYVNGNYDHTTINEVDVNIIDCWVKRDPDRGNRGGGGGGSNNNGNSSGYDETATPGMQYGKHGKIGPWVEEDETIEDEIIIDPSFENTKAECVYEKLINLSGGFKKAIQKFDGEFPVSHLKFKVASLPRRTIYAQTSPPQNYITEITLNEDILSELPTLMVAYLFIHETVHAEMHRKILSILDNGGNLDGLTKAQWESKLKNGDYPGIYDYFVRYGIRDMQHEQMSAHYINTMANLLKDFDSGQNSTQYYQDIAWEGLMGTSSYEKLSTSDKQRIKNTIQQLMQNGNKTCN